MARGRIEDYLQSNGFMLIDISPNLNPPFFVFNPFMGFKSASSINFSLETETYKPLNSGNTVHYVKSTTVEAITLERGAKFTDTDFYRWCERASNGIDQTRRNLMIVQFMGMGHINESPVLPGPFSQIVRVPGRTWILWECIPTGYNSGDLDATSSDITMMSLTLQPSAITEVALGAIV